MERRIVLVDDSGDVRYLLSTAMTFDGRFDVVGEAADARQAIEVVGLTHPDIVAVDLRLVGRSGAWLLSELRRRHGSSLVLVAVTGSDSRHEHARARAAGADAVLPKRELTSTLLDELWALANRQRAGDFVSPGAA